MTDQPSIFKYIGGAAGCGKTWMARERVAQNPRAIKLTASTGIAAINLGNNEYTCTTINSLLWYFDTRSLEDAWTTGKLERALSNLYAADVTEIIIDEVSMMSGRQIDIICQALDFMNEGKDPERQIGLTLIGDFCQLPPVTRRGERDEGFAFEAKRWDRFDNDTTILTEIKRQGDHDFIEALRHVRRGEGAEAVEFFKPHMEKLIDVDFDGTTVMAKNNEVDKFNELRLSRLDTEWVRWPSFRFDKQLSEWKKIPQVLDVKIDALVMILVNKAIHEYRNGERINTEIIYANGDLGYLRDYNKEEAIVELVRNGRTVSVPYTTKEHTVSFDEATPDQRARAASNTRNREAEDFERVRPPYVATDPMTQEPTGIVVGTCEHIPIRVAYATTCHKSQGLTLDRVQLQLNNQFFSQGGMAYVGLSRARAPEGLRIVCGNDNTFIKRCQYNPRVHRWL